MKHPGVEGQKHKISVAETNKGADVSKLMPEDAFFRLKSLGAGLHEKVV